MKKILIGMLCAAMSVSAMADMLVVVPSPKGWHTVVLPELAKHLGEPIRMEIIEGAKAIPAGDKWHEKYRFDNNAMWFSQGGQAEAFLIDKVKYNYADYEPIFAHNNSIQMAIRNGFDVYGNDKIKFGYSNGSNPDIMALTMMICGELPSMQAYKECYDKRVIYVKGMSQPEINLAFTRGELNVVRHHPNEWLANFYGKDIGKEWMSAGITNHKTGKLEPDTNFPVGQRSFPEAYKAKWGKEPKGEMYDAWLLVKGYRDVLQKVIWVNKNNPNKDRLIAAAKKMIADPESQRIIDERVGRYPWLVGGEVNQAYDQLYKNLSKKNLENLVWWTQNAVKMEASMKPEIVNKAAK